MESESRSKKLREEEVKLQEERKNFGDYVLKVSKEVRINEFVIKSFYE